LKYIQENEYRFVYQHIMAYRRVAYGGHGQTENVIKSNDRRTSDTHFNAHECRAKNNCARKTREAECTTCSDVSCCACGFPRLRGHCRKR